MTHTVQRGDTIVQIARKYGFRSIAPIWDHASNASLRAERPNPYVLSQGDQLFIPEKEKEEFQCETDRRHIFRVKNLTQWLDQRLLDDRNRPLSGKRYEVKVSGKTYEGQTDGDGRLRIEIPLDATTGTLKVWVSGSDAHEWTLQLGELEPVETTFGVKGHLSNLGYDCGEVNDTVDDATHAALRHFQADNNLPVSGEIDDATRNKLRDLFSYPVESGA